MYCARCGAEGESGARYCSVCGATFSKRAGSERASESLRTRALAAIGGNRRTRLVSVATAVAVAIAVIAFAALPAGTANHTAEDPSTLAIDHLCVGEKQRIADAAQSLSRASGATGRYAGSLVRILEEWRLALANAPLPTDMLAKEHALDSALLDTLAQAATLARVANGGGRSLILAQAGRVDVATTHVERAIASFGLAQCASLHIVGSHLTRS